MSDSADMVEASFSPDLPITSAKQDLLNRSSFAASVAKAIRNWNQKSSLVIGLFGDWGSGKSSIKNMILEGLREGIPEDDRLTVVEFNPWQISDPDRLTQGFFDEIGGVLGRPHGGEAASVAQRRAARWKLYSSYLSLGASITKSLNVGIKILGVPLVGAIVDAGETALEKAATVAKEGASGLEAAGQASARTLAELKREVSLSLGSLPRPVVVVLDDVDRLAADEIRLLFQLIKAGADFPNLIYLVLAQRDTVVKALEGIAPTRAEAFLEKIVQVALTVPRIERQQLEKALFAGLDRFLADKAVAQRFNSERWARLYRDGLRFFFENLRDVNRFLSSFGFHVGVFRSGDSFEVNPVDLIAIEVLRVFVGSVYERLPNIKHILTDEPRFMREEERELDAASLSELLESVATDRSTAVRSIVENLFPPAVAVLRGSYYSHGDNDWFRELRICSHDVFDRYFHFAVPSGDISQADLDEVISLIGNREALGNKFAELLNRGLLDVLLDRLDDYKDRLPLEHAEPFVTALFDLDVDANDQPFELRMSPQTHLQRIVHWYLRRERDQGQRKRILEFALANTTGLATPVTAVTWLETKKSEIQPTDPDALLERQSDIGELREQAVALLKKAAESGRLAKEKELRLLLSLWNIWGVPEEVCRWVSEFVEQPGGLLSFLRVMRNTQRSYGGPLPEETHYYTLSNLERYIGLDNLTSLVEELDSGNLTAEDSDNVRIFREALKRRAQGKADYAFPLRD